MAEEEVEIIIKLRDLQSFISGTEEARLSIKKIGEESKQAALVTDTSLKKVHGVVGSIAAAARSSATALAHMGSRAHTALTKAGHAIRSTAHKPLFGGGPIGEVAGLAAGAISVESVKQSIETTTGLAKAAETFHQVTGMSTKDAVTWQALVGAYGLSSRSFGLTLKSVATQTQGALTGSKAAKKEFQALGITTKELRSRSGNLDNTLSLVLDRFNKMPGGVQKTSLATKLFGRNWQQLMPLLSEGGKALEEQRKQASAFGITLGGNATKNAKRLHEAEISLKLATMGLQVQFAEHLAPILFKVFGYVMKLYAVIRQQMTPAFNEAGKAVSLVTKFLKEHHTILKIVEGMIAYFAAAWVIGKAAIIGARIATVAMNGAQIVGKTIMIAYKAVIIAFRVVMLAAQAAIWLFNGALAGNPIAIVIIAIIALVAAIVLLITHWHQVTRAVTKFFDTLVSAASTAITWVLDFLKKNWTTIIMIFGGPIGIVVGLFFKFKDQIMGVINDVINFIKSIPDAISSAFMGVFNAITQPFKDAWNWLSSLHISIKHTHIGPISVPSGISVTHAQFGANVISPGAVMVGESGPEILHLPRGASVTPLASTGIGTVGQSDKVLPPFVISVQVERKEIASAVAKYTTDRLARR